MFFIFSCKKLFLLKEMEIKNDNTPKSWFSWNPIVELENSWKQSVFDNLLPADSRVLESHYFTDSMLPGKPQNTLLNTLRLQY